MKMIKTAVITLILAMPALAFGNGNGDGVKVKTKSELDNAININVGDEDNSRAIGSPDQSLKTVPDVVAPGLTTTLSETCMGSTSTGVGWLGGGFSFGTTWRDKRCVIRLDSRQILAFGVATKDYAHVVAAKELMCSSKEVRGAYERAGKPCVQTQREQEKVRQASLSTPNPAVAEIDSDAPSGGTQKAAFEWPNYMEDGG